jgi:hypothetical protein
MLTEKLMKYFFLCNLYMLKPAVYHAKQYICIGKHNNSGKRNRKGIYINVNHDMFRPLLGQQQVYLCVLIC